MTFLELLALSQLTILGMGLVMELALLSGLDRIIKLISRIEQEDPE